MEHPVERQLIVREVTQVQASWTEGERGVPGAFTLQLILDHGAEEYVLQPTADDVRTLLALVRGGDHAMFDLDRRVLMFAPIGVGRGRG